MEGDIIKVNTPEMITIKPRINPHLNKFRNGPKSEGKVPIDPSKLRKYVRGEKVNPKHVKIQYGQVKQKRREKNVQFCAEHSARAEILLTESSGYLEAEDGEITRQYTQSDIVDSVDITSASKRFDLHLHDFGPYRMSYSRNGRHLLLGGKRGHVAAMDWVTKKLLCEINVMESVHDVTWMHQETMFAVAQKKWVYFYDNVGVELHCVKKLDHVLKMEFLPYHFLLATVSTHNYINWLDVSIGKLVTSFHIPNHGVVSTVTQHPANALICIGQPSGIISLWSPNSNKPAVTKWCHKQPITSLAFDPRGSCLATASADRSLKIWDARQLSGPVQEYRLKSAPQCLSFSHKGTLAVGLGNVVEIYNDKYIEGRLEKNVYLRHKFNRTIGNMQFCPFEDVLGVAHAGGFSSLLVPGSGEPNFDALEINPYQTKSQRRETEVKALLGKIPSELITWDTRMLQKLHTPSLVEMIEHKKKQLHVKPPEIEIKIKKKTGSAKVAKKKQMLKEDAKRKYFKALKESNSEEMKIVPKPEKKKKTGTVLDRFL